MHNKTKLKKYLITTLIISLIAILLFLWLNILEYHTLVKNYNYKLATIITKVKETTPNITEAELMEIINSKTNPNFKLFAKYGIDLNTTSLVLENNNLTISFIILNIIFLIIILTLFITIFLIYDNHTSHNLRELTKYLEEINKRNYNLNLDSNSEDELSILKNEIYKTTIMLKEQAELSKKEQKYLKKSLEDISHQLKTPLTSILVMIDNLLDEENMDLNTRNDFLRDIKRQLINTNFLVNTLLKLSKLDAKTIEFNNKPILVKDLINETIKNVKNITIKIKGDPKIYLTCDAKWQIEALTNILKNSLEHSFNKSNITINYEQNKVYTKITIEDNGEGISKEDLKHIFERFYQAKNANPDSIGIGLALAKTIIEQNNGTISVSSNSNGTTFKIKYFNL